MWKKRKYFPIVSVEVTLGVSFAMKCTFSTDTPQRTAQFYLLSLQQPLDLFCKLFLLKYASRYSFKFASPEHNACASPQIKALTHDWYSFVHWIVIIYLLRVWEKWQDWKCGIPRDDVYLNDISSSAAVLMVGECRYGSTILGLGTRWRRYGAGNKVVCNDDIYNKTRER
jgi:hypothetical protein